MIDTWIVNGIIVTESWTGPATLGLLDGRIAVLQDIAAPRAASRETIDARGLVVLPGAIDAHTHFTGSNDDPLHEIREGMKGALVGGVTTILEMPHSDPPATSLAAFREKASVMAANAPVDFALWAGLTNDNLSELGALHDEGAIGFKGFMCSGEEDGSAPDGGLPSLRDDTLLSAMRSISELGGLIGLHAENQNLLVAARLRLRAAGRSDMVAHAECHPEIAELEAVSRATLFARETGVRCHIVHVSSARAASLIYAQRGDRPITLETCPHYLLLDEEDLVRLGAKTRCGPALRSRAIVDALWHELEAGRIDMLASDHCPYCPERKVAGTDGMWQVGMGLSGIETAVPLFFSAAVIDRGLSLQRFAELTATAPSRIFGLYPRKGVIAIGSDADLVFYDPEARRTVSGAAFQGSGTWSAFEGFTYRGAVQHVLQRGRTVYDGTNVRAEPGDGRRVYAKP